MQLYLKDINIDIINEHNNDMLVLFYKTYKCIKQLIKQED